MHSYIALALVARMLGARIVIEFHEVQDPGEFAFPAARLYLRTMAPLLLRMSDGFVVHTEADRDLLHSRYPLQKSPVEVMPHGPHDHYQWVTKGEVERVAPQSACNLLFFGLIRPYKGLDSLIRAFDRIPESQISQYWLTIVGETWEGWTLPAELVKASRYRDRICRRRGGRRLLRECRCGGGSIPALLHQRPAAHRDGLRTPGYRDRGRRPDRNS